VNRFWIFFTLFLAINCSAQVPDPCADPVGKHYVKVAKGTLVTACFDYPDELRPQLRYFRVRLSQTPAGAYNVVAQLPPDSHFYRFTANSEAHIFVSAVANDVDDQGNPIAIESPGSQQVWVAIETAPAATATPAAAARSAVRPVAVATPAGAGSVASAKAKTIQPPVRLKARKQ
jgi:hypothetical protein